MFHSRIECLVFECVFLGYWLASAILSVDLAFISFCFRVVLVHPDSYSILDTHCVR